MAVGERSGDPDLTALSRHGQGRALLHCGRVEEGRSLLDEVMMALTTDDVSPRVAGIIYCSVIAACHDSFDLGRAQQWTAALDAWSVAQPEKGLFRGECLAHRTEMLQGCRSMVGSLRPGDEGVLGPGRATSPPLDGCCALSTCRV